MNIKDTLRILTTPSCWIRVGTKNKVLTVVINNLIDNNAEVSFPCAYSVTLGHLRLWTRNYPYSYGGLHWWYDDIPDRTTVFRLHDYIYHKRLASYIEVEKATNESEEA